MPRDSRVPADAPPPGLSGHAAPPPRPERHNSRAQASEHPGRGFGNDHQLAGGGTEDDVLPMRGVGGAPVAAMAAGRSAASPAPAGSRKASCPTGAARGVSPFRRSRDRLQRWVSAAGQDYGVAVPLPHEDVIDGPMKQRAVVRKKPGCQVGFPGSSPLQAAVLGPIEARDR